MYSKTLQLSDYVHMKRETQHIYNVVDVFRGCSSRFEHKHRLWEYGMALKAIARENTRTLLDVGGGGSIFAPATAWIGKKVLQVDPGELMAWIAQQNTVLQKHGFSNLLAFSQLDFLSFDTKRRWDIVTCISVLEHVPNDIEFFKRLLRYVTPGGTLFLTVDFYPGDGQPIVSGHLRTYNAEMLQHLIDIASDNEFVVVGDNPDYKHYDLVVNGCSFASIVLQKSPGG